MKSITCYKIVDISDDNTYKTLFHGVNGSKTIPLNTWIKAERKWAGEGGNKYWTGFHVLTNRAECAKYFKRFTDVKKSRTIVKCLAVGLRPKKSSNGKVHLAAKITILSSK